MDALASPIWGIEGGHSVSVRSERLLDWTKTHLRPRDQTSLDNHLRLLSELLRLPKHEISQSTRDNLTDEVAHAVRDRPARVQEAAHQQ